MENRQNRPLFSKNTDQKQTSFSENFQKKQTYINFRQLSSLQKFMGPDGTEEAPINDATNTQLVIKYSFYFISMRRRRNFWDMVSEIR